MLGRKNVGKVFRNFKTFMEIEIRNGVRWGREKSASVNPRQDQALGKHRVYSQERIDTLQRQSTGADRQATAFKMPCTRSRDNVRVQTRP